MNEMITINTTQRMTSLEIAELMNKQHKHVRRDIEKLITEQAIGRSGYGPTSYFDEWNRKQPMYELDFQATMILITGYDAKRRAMVIDRWLKLETGQAEPSMHSPRMSRAHEELNKVQAESQRLKDFVLAQVPMWDKIKRYTDMGLSRKEICLLCKRHRDTIRKHMRRMEACGIIDPPMDLEKLQGNACHLVALSGGAR